MNWERHIERWSRVPVHLQHIARILFAADGQDFNHDSTASFFVVVAKGSAAIHTSSGTFMLHPDTIYHGSLQEPIRLQSTSEDFLGYYLQYEALSTLPEDTDGFGTSYVCTPHACHTLLDDCQSMYRLWASSSAWDRLHARSVFLTFAYELMRQLHTANRDSKKRSIVTEAIRYLHHAYKRPITAEELASSFDCSASYLSRLFKSQIGMSPIDYLIHLRIEKAKRLLNRSDMRIQDVADRVGYSDVYYFSRLFKKHTGSAPLQYRAQYQSVQNNPSRLLKSSIVYTKSDSYNENEIYFHIEGDGETFMFRFTKTNIATMLIVFTALLLSACQQSNNSQPATQTDAGKSAENTASETRLYDHLMGQAEIPTQPQKVVSLFHLGQLMALGVDPIGATSYQLQNPLLGDVSHIADIGAPPNLELILSLNPDLIITTQPFAEIVEGGFEALEQIAPTIVVEQHDDPIKDIEMFGDILGRQEEAKQWNEAFINKIATSKERVSPYINADETFSIINVRPKSFFVYGDSNMGGNILFRYLELTPQAKIVSDVINGDTWEISSEVIPDFVGDRLFLAINEGAEDNVIEVEKLLQNTKAWQSKHVYKINFDEFLFSDPISVDKQMDIIVDMLDK